MAQVDALALSACAHFTIRSAREREREREKRFPNNNAPFIYLIRSIQLFCCKTFSYCWCFIFRQVLATNSALMGNAPPATKANHSTDSADLSSEAAEEAEKDRRRLDTENDLLEEFLENEGKILRLPTAGDSGNLDIDALTKVIC